MNVFLDASALAKRYVEEKGSPRVEEILQEASALGVSVLCAPEVVSALCRRRREGILSRRQYETGKRALFSDLSDATVIAVTHEVVAKAVGVLERWAVRSSDALHVASAAIWAPGLFVSADVRQCEAARGLGLDVECVSGP